MLGLIKDLLTQKYYNKKAPEAFKNFYRYSTESSAFLAYCKELHGLDFPVQNNLSKDQFKFLIKEFKKANTVVLAISPDAPERLARFADRDSLNFTLLSDEDHKIADKYGAWGPKKFIARYR